jgi:MurNAc alpha-1-phosphate uridylyltransferase
MAPSTHPNSAMLLAAGLGTRMRPLTFKKPKPLIEVAGRPMIDHLLLLLEKAQVDSVVVNMHHLAEQMEQHLADHVAGRRSPTVILSDEREELLDSGGGIKKALPHLGQKPFFVLNGDSFWVDGPRANLTRLASFWDGQQMDILLLVANGAQATGYEGLGDFTMTQDGRLHWRVERQVAPFIYAGVGIIKPELFDAMPEGAFSLTRLFREAQAKGRLFGLRLDGGWLHVGTPEAIALAEAKLSES